MDPIGRPARIFVSSLAMSKLHNHAGRHVHGKDVEVTGFKSTSPRKSNMLAIGAPRGIHRVAFPRGQAENVRSIYIHSIYLRRATAPAHKNYIRASFRIYFRLDVQGTRVGNLPKPAAIQI